MEINKTENNEKYLQKKHWIITQNELVNKMKRTDNFLNLILD